MRRIILALIITSLIIGSTGGCSTVTEPKKDFDMDLISSEVTLRNVDFALDILKELNKEDLHKNIFISPLSISTALTMTYNGAAGETMTQMEKGLRYEGLDKNNITTTYQHLMAYLSQVDKEVDLTISNSIWYRQGEAIKQEFIDINKQFFNAEVMEMDFTDPKSADTINNWIKTSTKDKIEKMLDPPIPADVVMYLINAVYFKGDWTTQFNKEHTVNTFFNGLNKNIQSVDMMSRKGPIDYGVGEDYQVVRLPYGDGKVSMYVILPELQQDIYSFLKSMDRNKYMEIKSSIELTEEVTLNLPKFKMEYGIKEINNQLIAMGMEHPFSPTADFSDIREGLFISRVLHKAVIEVNEEGSEAAGVTVVELAESAAMDPIVFTADRPFLFMIVEDETDTILFLGKFVNAE
jgi:serpin B